MVLLSWSFVIQWEGNVASRNYRNVTLPGTIILLGREGTHIEHMVSNRKAKCMSGLTWEYQVKSMFKILPFIENSSKAGHDLTLHVYFSCDLSSTGWSNSWTVYLFQIQILPVTLSDAWPKSFGNAFLFTFCFTPMYVGVWICVHNLLYICDRMYAHIHTHMWKSELKLGYYFSGEDRLVLWDSVSHQDTRLIN